LSWGIKTPTKGDVQTNQERKEGAYLPYVLTLGKHTKNYGKSPCLMGKFTINGPCSIAMLNYQRVTPWFL
jgi:hypothetical protein